MPPSYYCRPRASASVCQLYKHNRREPPPQRPQSESPLGEAPPRGLAGAGKLLLVGADGRCQVSVVRSSSGCELSEVAAFASGARLPFDF